MLNWKHQPIGAPRLKANLQADADVDAFCDILRLLSRDLIFSQFLTSVWEGAKERVGYSYSCIFLIYSVFNGEPFGAT